MSTTIVYRPADGTELARVEDTPIERLDEIFATAREAQAKWAKTPTAVRAGLMLDASRALAAARDELGQVDSDNSGKSTRDALREAERCSAALVYYGGWADKAYGATVPIASEVFTYTVREPYGVVVGITPWNVGLRLSAKKAAQAIAFGNACILKPAPETPLPTLKLVEIMESAGIPAGLVQVVTGGGAQGAALVEHPGTDLISFTGSTVVGKQIAATAGHNLRPVVLELGGKSPQVVFADADLEAAADSVLNGVFRFAGQMCVAGSRVFVEDSIYDRFNDMLAERTAAVVVGDPADPAVHVGPQVSAVQRDKTLAAIAQAQADGARIVAQAALPTDPRLAGGYYTPPTIFADAGPDSSLVTNEVFGPVFSVARFADEAEAVSLANGTRYGLAAGIWTSDGARAHRMVRDVKAGVVWVNSYLLLSDQLSFGGDGDSGLNREGGDEAFHTYTKAKAVSYALTKWPITLSS